MMEAIDEKQIVRFLLGQLAEERRAGIEDRMFSDNGFYEHVLAIQEELADDYVLDNLTTDQRVHFEKNFLRSPRRRERVAFATAFTQALADQNSPYPATAASETRDSRKWWSFLWLANRPQLAFAAMAAAFVLLVGAAWLYVQNRGLTKRVEIAQSEQQAVLNTSREKAEAAEIERQRLERENADLRAQSAEIQAKIQEREQQLEAANRASEHAPPAITSQIATFILSPGLTRGSDEPEKVMISGKSRFIQLQLALAKPEDYKGYVAEVRTARGNLIFSKSLPAAQQMSFGPAVSVTLPTDQIPIGEYEVTLKGAASGKLQSVGYYYFIALKR